MARSKQHDPIHNAEGAFADNQSEHEPSEISGGTASSTPSPGKSKSSQPHEVTDDDTET